MLRFMTARGFRAGDLFVRLQLYETKVRRSLELYLDEEVADTCLVPGRHLSW
jgi:hypothetical protein